MPNNLEKLFYRIILGYYFIDLDNKTYKIVYPSMNIKYAAEILHDKIIEDNKYDKRWLTKKEIDFYLLMNNIWNKSKEEELDKNSKFLEDTKIDLYLNFHTKSKRDNLKKRINMLNQNIQKMTIEKNSMNHLGIEEHAVSIKNEFIIMNTIYYQDKLVFENPEKDDYDNQKLQSFIREIVDHTLSIDSLRELAKSEIWKSYAATANLNKDFIDINDDYRHLVSLFKMYDNIKQHPDCPAEEIINDDDALDGWFLYQNRKAQKEKKKNAVLDKFGGNIKNAQEVFLITNDMQETKDIYDLNDLNERHKIKELIHTANSKDSPVKWQDLGFVQRDLKQQIADKTQGYKGKE